ncbi:MAG: Fur family transcriptional regulator [Thermoguttaceae bacterium]|jgi:Fur family ferric uptake transcriptional regulator|nr:Fur family transcriptional regulator [Thermoguttaceae bacterium]
MPDSFSLGSVDVKLAPTERFTQFLQGRGKRLTRQRQLIVEMVFSHHDHFDAEELIDHLRPLIAARKVSRPTIYRTLGELVEARMLRAMTLRGRSVYEHDYGYPRHDHLHCQNCGRLIEFHSKQIERLCEQVAEEYDFQVAGHRVFITGTCAECRQKG